MKKLKNTKEINDFKNYALSFTSQIDLGEPLPKNIIDEIHSGETMLVDFKKLISALDKKMGSVIALICEFEKVKLDWWDYANVDVPRGVDIRVYDNMISFYCEYKGSGVYSDLLEDDHIPIEYLWMSSNEVISDLVSRICVYNEKENSRKEKQNIKKKEKNDRDKGILDY